MNVNNSSRINYLNKYMLTFIIINDYILNKTHKFMSLLFSNTRKIYIFYALIAQNCFELTYNDLDKIENRFFLL